MSTRIDMSSTERQILRANIELVRQLKELKRDMGVLVSYIKGNKNLEEEVENLLRIYSVKKQPSKYERGVDVD